MHDCPNCGMACDCDGEDMWYDWPSPEVKNCQCACEEAEDDDWGEYEYDDDNEAA